MRVTYDPNTGGVIDTTPYPCAGSADFPDQPSVTPGTGMSFIEYLHVEVAASPGRYKVTGPPGRRQLLDAGVAIATEITKVAPFSSGQALVFSVVFG